MKTTVYRWRPAASPATLVHVALDRSLSDGSGAVPVCPVICPWPVRPRSTILPPQSCPFPDLTVFAMADFKTHITTSTTLGIVYGGVGGFLLQDANGSIPLTTCALSAGLCSIAGMLPDLDSDSGIPLRETIAFTAAVVPMLLIDRFSHLGLSPESMVLAGILIYLLIRFGFFELLKRYTVHRGMFHSLPAAVIAAELGFLLCSCEGVRMRYYKAGAVFLGFMSHLILDEIYSVDLSRLRIKNSFGTAVKLWGKYPFANFSTYAKVVVLGMIAFVDPIWMEAVEDQVKQGKAIPRIAIEKLENIWR